MKERSRTFSVVLTEAPDLFEGNDPMGVIVDVLDIGSTDCFLEVDFDDSTMVELLTRELILTELDSNLKGPMTPFGPDEWKTFFDLKASGALKDYPRSKAFEVEVNESEPTTEKGRQRLFQTATLPQESAPKNVKGNNHGTN